jgi:hypothetical protein
LTNIYFSLSIGLGVIIVQKSREKLLIEVDCAYADAKKRGEEFDLSQFNLTEEERRQIEESWRFTKMFIDAHKRSSKLFTCEKAQLKKKN